jgi:DNA end-binding protein Ku
MKAIWSGSIGFGLVNIPVKLYSATQDSALDLDMLDKKGHANIRYARINANTGNEVEWKDIVKGFKLNEKYVVLTDADFRKVAPEKNKMINITEFAGEEAIDTAFYETPYYLEPAKGGEKA